MTLPIPTLLLRPEGSYDRNGSVSPTLTGAVRVVDGEHGDAWFVEEGTTNLMPNPVAFTDLTAFSVYNGGEAGSAVITRTATSPLGPFSGVKVDVTNMQRGVIARSGIGLGITGSTTPITASVFAAGPASVRINTEVVYTDGTKTNGVTRSYVLTASAERMEAPPVTPDPSKTISRVDAFIVSTIAATATFHLSRFQIEHKPYATSYCDGSLGTGYSWAGTAHASASTRAAGVITALAASAPAATALLYRDSGGTWDTAYLEGTGTFGTYGSLTHAGGTITLAPSSRGIEVAALATFSRALTDTERAELFAMDTWEWDRFGGRTLAFAAVSS